MEEKVMLGIFVLAVMLMGGLGYTVYDMAKRQQARALANQEIQNAPGRAIVQKAHNGCYKGSVKLPAYHQFCRKNGSLIVRN